MGGICRPSQGLWHLQSRTTHCHTRKIWRTPKTTLSDQPHVQQNHIQAHHQQGGDIYWIQSGCKTRRYNCPGTIYVLNHGLLWNNGRGVDDPRIKQSPICAQIQLTKINQKISEPPTSHLLIWNTIWLILHVLCRQRRIVLNPGLILKKGLPSFPNTFLDLDLKCTLARGKSLKGWMRIFPTPSFL